MRSHVRDSIHNLLLLLLGQAHVLILLPPVKAQPVERLSEIFFYVFFSTQVGHDPVHLVGKHALDLIVVNSQGINLGLHQEKLRLHYGLQQLAALIPIGRQTLSVLVLYLIFQVRQGYRLVSNHCDGLVYVFIFLS